MPTQPAADAPPALGVPIARTRFLGRSEELRLVPALMADASLVTLTGAGGCGKTSLAAAIVGERVSSGVVAWVDLAALTDAALVPKAVGSALQLADRPGTDPLSWLAQSLQGKDVLVVLDNCEHLVQACAELVSHLLQACPGVRVLATSREPLGVGDEITYRVPSLDVPALDASADEVRATTSAVLFADRAARARPGFAITADNAAAVGAICRHLDGIPLALELAAGRIRMMTPAQIAEGLGDRFRLLTGGRRTALPRQRTLEASVGWSYELLDDDEAWVLRRLSVFAGTFGLEPALAVCTPGPEERLDVVGRLVERSLIQVDDSSAAAKYRLLESVRDYARNRLDADELAEARHHHLEVYVQVAEASEATLFGPGAVAGLDRLDVEVDNLRAAMEWAADSDRVDQALRIAGALWIYWFIRTRHDEGLKRLQHLLETAPDAPPLLRYKVLIATLMLMLSSSTARGLPLAQEARSIADALGDDGLRSQAYAWLGQIEHLRGAVGDPGLLDESLRLARAAGDIPQIGRSLQWLGTVVGMQGDPARGAVLLDEAIAMFRETASVLQLGWALLWRGVVALFSGDLDGAVTYQSEAYALLTARREDSFAAFSLAELASLALLRGDLDAAERQITTARTAAAFSVAPLVESHSTAVAGWLALARGDVEEALALSALSLAAAEETETAAGIGFALLLRGAAAFRIGQLEVARHHLERAEETAASFPMIRARALLGLSELAVHGGRAEAALDLAHDGLRTAVEANDAVATIDALELIAGWASAEPLALRLLGAAERARTDIGYARYPCDAPAHQSLIGRLRDTLGSEADEHWAAGLKLTLDGAAALAGRGRGPRQRPTTGWSSLTPVEREVADLVAQGLSNPEIAARLFVSRSTVKAHLAHAYAKLGVANRSELAAEVSRRS